MSTYSRGGKNTSPEASLEPGLPGPKRWLATRFAPPTHTPHVVESLVLRPVEKSLKRKSPTGWVSSSGILRQGLDYESSLGRCALCVALVAQ